MGWLLAMFVLGLCVGHTVFYFKVLSVLRLAKKIIKEDRDRAAAELERLG